MKKIIFVLFIMGSISIHAGKCIKKWYPMLNNEITVVMPIILCSPAQQQQPIIKTEVYHGHYANDDYRLQRGDARRSYGSSNGVITDKITKLAWQDSRLPETMDYDSAVRYCQNLNLNGKRDWRLPEMRELVTLLDFSKSSNLIDDTFDTRLPKRFWTHTSYKADPSQYAYYVDFNNGFSFLYNDRKVFKKSNKYNVRCVRGTKLAKHTFVKKGDVVIDKNSNLMWEDTPETKKRIGVADAIKRCEALTLGGYDDWHLPSINELYTIADRSTFDPAINSAFKHVNKYGPGEKNFHHGHYWSSTLYVPDSRGFYYYRHLNMQNGASFRCRDYIGSQSRCVRTYR